MELFLAGTGLAVEDGVFEGLGGSSAPWAEGGELAIEPRAVDGQVALTGSHLVNAARQEFGETHEGVGGQGWGVGVPGGRGGQCGPLAEEDGPGFLLHRRVRVGGRVGRR